ncbi:hypothetical protein CUB97_03350 [Prevotella intermedia]|uniref:Uncharacterized protein n=1 Tax=Prevotella intermedia TaxID=28131 RepID=A0A2M8M853_PREIN|nr:hypothetical protein CUB97_03350 [Prevotella intermedia]
MIRTNIQNHFPHQLTNGITTCSSIYVADYTEQTKLDKIKRAVELIKGSPPSDIDYFTVNNSCNLEIDGIPFNNTSFIRANGSPLSQCESTIYPHNSNNNPWILFLELKYSCKSENNENNLNKARRQLFKTQYYYRSQGVFDKNNTCYLLASLPMQRPPFANISLTQPYLSAMKRRHNVVIRFQNSVEIIDDKKIKV